MDSASAAPSSARDFAERLLTRVKPFSSFACYTANTTALHSGFLIQWQGDGIDNQFMRSIMIKL